MEDKLCFFFYVMMSKYIRLSWQYPVDLSTAQLPLHQSSNVVLLGLGQRLHSGDIMLLPQVIVSIKIMTYIITYVLVFCLILQVKHAKLILSFQVTIQIAIRCPIVMLT